MTFLSRKKHNYTQKNEKFKRTSAVKSNLSRLFTVLFGATVFTLLPFLCVSTEKNQAHAAAESSIERQNSQQETDKFENPFENADGIHAEDIGVKINDQGNERESKSSLKIVMICVAAAVASGVVVVSMKSAKKSKRKQTELALQRNLSITKKFVSSNPDLYADVADMIQTRKCRFIYAQEDGVFFQDDDGFYGVGTYVLAAKDEAAARKIILLCPEEYSTIKNSALVCHGEKAAAFCVQFFGFDRITKCFQTTYTPLKPLPLKGALRFETAGEKQLQTIIDTYDRESPDSLRKLVSLGKIHCAYATETNEQGEAEEQFVGYIGLHPEGSMGLLLIFPPFRRRGYAEELESYEINEIKKAGRTPYAHIVTDNFKSLALQKKLGANVADDLVIWLSRSDRQND